jgi:hypothetical protein
MGRLKIGLECMGWGRGVAGYWGDCSAAGNEVNKWIGANITGISGEKLNIDPVLPSFVS